MSDAAHLAKPARPVEMPSLSVTVADGDLQSVEEDDVFVACVHVNVAKRPREGWGCRGLVVCGMTTLPFTPEFRGYVCTRVIMALATVHFSVAFGPAVLTLALRSVGCSTDTDTCGTGGKCSKKLWGLISASSYLTVGVTVAALLVAVMSPLMGVVCDFTPHRKRIWRISAVGVGVCMLAGSMIDDDEMVLLALFVVSVLFFVFMSLLTLTQFSYLPELTFGVEHKPRATAAGFIWTYATQVVAIGVVVVVGFTLDLSSRTSAMVWSVVLGSVVLLLTPVANQSLRHRSAVRSHPKLARFAFFPDLFWTLVAILLFDPGLNGLVVIAATYLTDHLCFESNEVSLVVGVAVVAALPGVFVSSKITAGKPRAVHRVLLVSLFAVAVVTLASPFCLSSGDTQLACFFGSMWGLSTGMAWHTAAAMVAMLVPGGQESEIAGLLLFCYKAFQWLPPFAFTLMNEAASSQFGLLSLVAFFVLGGIVASRVDVDRGIAVVAKSLEKRRGFSADRASRRFV